MGACTTQAVSTDAGTGTGGRGGTTATAGTTGSMGGSGGMYVLVDGTVCLPPAASGLITDFTYATPDAAAPSDAAADGGTVAVVDQIHFGDDTTALSGGEFYYPNASSTATPAMYQLVSNVTGSNWHVTGSVGDYSGLGFYFDSCNKIDASAFKGISFNISGTVQGSAVTVEIDTLNDTLAASWINTHTGTADPAAAGRCLPGPTAVNQYAQSDCVEPTKVVTVPATPGAPINVLWGDFTTGKPEAAVTPSQILAIRFIFPNPVGVATPSVAAYPLDVTIDNIAFIP